jgi:hypothetical protein
VKPDLDQWLPSPALRVAHGREAAVAPERLWECAQRVRVRDAAVLGRLVRWRIPGTPTEIAFDRLFRQPPFLVLEEHEGALVSGLVGRIWTLRRDYPTLRDPDEFRAFSERGTARVVFANWVEPAGPGRARLASEARVQPLGVQGRVGLAAVRPVVSAFQNLIGSDGIEAAIRLAERR